MTTGSAIAVGSILEGTITGITNFGAFVQLPENKVGLVHISEVANEYVKDIKDFIKEKDTVKVKVLTIDANGKISLSIRQLQAPPPRPVFREERRPVVHRAPEVTFEDKIAKFMKDSDEKISEVRRNTDSKRGGRGARRS
jgi:Predicted RNA binding protein (contains ribosomal protein S1 domain)